MNNCFADKKKLVWNYCGKEKRWKDLTLRMKFWFLEDYYLKRWRIYKGYDIVYMYSKQIGHA